MRSLTAALAAWALAAASCPAAQAQREWRAGEWVAPPAAQTGTAEGDLAAIRQQVDRGHNRLAVKAVKRFVCNYPDSPHREEAFMLAGQAEINRGRYWQAYQWYEKQLAEFPVAKWSDRALQREYEIGEEFLRGKKRIVLGFLPLPAQSEGLEILSRLAEHAPGSQIAQKALMRIADYHYERSDYLDAADAYDRYLLLFAKQPGAADAMLKAASATYCSFQGTGYDLTPLIEARQRFQAFKDRFPIQAEQARVPQTLDKIDSLQAQADYETGEFYKRQGRKTAAAFYFNQVLRRHPETVWADRAREQLSAAEDRAQAQQPATPPAPAAEPAAPEASE